MRRRTHPTSRTLARWQASARRPADPARRGKAFDCRRFMMLREGRLQGCRRLQRGPPSGLSQAATGAACRVIAGCNDRPGGHFIEMVRPSARKKKRMPLVPGMGPGMVPAKAQLPQTPLAPLTPAAALARSSESMSAPLASSSGDRGWSSNDLSNNAWSRNNEWSSGSWRPSSDVGGGWH